MTVGIAGLEDHRAGDVAHRQGVLRWRTQMMRVEFLWQLGRDRGDDEREQGLIHAETATRWCSTASTNT